jgi:carboxyl-terminal processing protease
MDPEEVKAFNQEMSQDYAGIGITVSVPKGKGAYGMQVNELFPGGPAEKAGLRRDDVIVSADGFKLDKTLDENVKHVRGEPRTKVALEILREGKLFKVVSGRDKVESPSVFGAFCECSGADAYFLRISGFHYLTGLQAAEEMSKAAEKKPKAIVMDLRDNPGGSLGASVELASLFLPDGATVVSDRERGKPELFMGAFPEEGQPTGAPKGSRSSGLSDDFWKIRADLREAWPGISSVPLYVLTTGGSASASEIVAAAMKDNKRAVLIGEKTFGKGSVQTVTPLPNGGSLRLTTARYYTPSGASIQAVGVLPDVEVKDARAWKLEAMERNKARYMDKAPTSFLREADLPRHLGATYLTLDEQTAKAEKELSEMLDEAKPKADEPYERRFSYGPMGSDGKPDPMTAKALELARAALGKK